MVTVLVIPLSDAIHPDAPVPDRQFLNAVCAWLDPSPARHHRAARARSGLRAGVGLGGRRPAAGTGAVAGQPGGDQCRAELPLPAHRRPPDRAVRRRPRRQPGHHGLGLAARGQPARPGRRGRGHPGGGRPVRRLGAAGRRSAPTAPCSPRSTAWRSPASSCPGPRSSAAPRRPPTQPGSSPAARPSRPHRCPSPSYRRPADGHPGLPVPPPLRPRRLGRLHRPGARRDAGRPVAGGGGAGDHAPHLLGVRRHWPGAPAAPRHPAVPPRRAHRPTRSRGAPRGRRRRRRHDVLDRRGPARHPAARRAPRRSRWPGGRWTTWQRPAPATCRPRPAAS